MTFDIVQNPFDLGENMFGIKGNLSRLCYYTGSREDCERYLETNKEILERDEQSNYRLSCRVALQDRFRK